MVELGRVDDRIVRVVRPVLCEAVDRAPVGADVLFARPVAGLAPDAELRDVCVVAGAGGPALREMSFAQRGELLSSMSKALYAKREEFIEQSLLNTGVTR